MKNLILLLAVLLLSCEETIKTQEWTIEGSYQVESIEGWGMTETDGVKEYYATEKTFNPFTINFGEDFGIIKSEDDIVGFEYYNTGAYYSLTLDDNVSPYYNLLSDFKVMESGEKLVIHTDLYKEGDLKITLIKVE